MVIHKAKKLGLLNKVEERMKELRTALGGGSDYPPSLRRGHGQILAHC